MELTYAVVMVSDMSKAVPFYRDLVGLPLKLETTHWSEFSTGHATLALHLAEPSDAGSAVGTGSAGSCRPGLRVANLDEFHRQVIARGVRCVQPPRDSFGAKIATYADPDGLHLLVSEVRGKNSAGGDQ